ncbi:MAG: V-type ATP synthase subunit F [Saccharolobus sp.]|jgi:V/A-type H+-transporting ATPase subunit F|uniref:V-type ATP synthase subunit F n=1 Tax=Saccharolobus sp. TaxID=2100761 RepID=UPI0028CF4150|nr:V-type ATP synthase subunit F [Saccharolobus sp.]MDT7861036.1 V-type ATP synthase subunit F [Saccharolobus sp.]
MGKVFVLGDKYTVSLFKLVGAEGDFIEDPYQLPDSITKLKKREDIDLILITKDIYEPIKEKLDSIIVDQKKPLITIIPSPFSESKPIDVRKMIMKALGFG